MEDDRVDAGAHGDENGLGKHDDFIQVHTAPLNNNKRLETCEKNDDRRNCAAYRRGKWRPHRDCRGREVGERATCARATKASGQRGYEWPAVACRTETLDKINQNKVPEAFEMKISPLPQSHRCDRSFS
jgi:hypothetical protein